MCLIKKKDLKESNSRGVFNYYRKITSSSSVHRGCVDAASTTFKNVVDAASTLFLGASSTIIIRQFKKKKLPVRRLCIAAVSMPRRRRLKTSRPE